jgi:RHS repeat-associated protein
MPSSIRPKKLTAVRPSLLRPDLPGALPGEGRRSPIWTKYQVWMLCAPLLCGLAHADSYEYDELGNLKTLTSPRGVRGYTYDEIQRLDTETGYSGHRDHAYDHNGNRTTDGAASPGSPTTASYAPGTNRIATINGAAVTLDAAGQITHDGLNSYTWDDAGRLKTVSRGGQLRATYHYDYKHRRTRKVTTAAAPRGAQTVVYHYDDQDRLITETTQTGTPLHSYAWSDENLIGQVEYVANATNTGYEIGRIVYYELDHLGTPRQARERTGTVVWRWESDGYGNTLPDEDPDGNGQKTYVYLRFPGQYFDEESGLHYNWHRYYVPRLGRYLSSDPIGIEGGRNSYGYVGGNPLRYTDPTGEVAVPVVIGGTIAVGACIAANCTKPIGQAMQSAANSLSNAINTVKEWCSDDDDEDSCEERQEAEEDACQKCWGHWSYRGCMERARIRGDMCRRGIPNPPPPWSDADVDGWAPPPAPRGNR